MAFPYLLLLVSGGHCQLLIVEGVGRYRRLGTTIDDAAGEAFDKGAKLLGLGYPGGPAIERAAAARRCRRASRCRGRCGGGAGCDFSFSGLKTALAQTVDAILRAEGALAPRDVADLAAALQAAIADCLVDRTRQRHRRFRAAHPQGRVAGRGRRRRGECGAAPASRRRSPPTPASTFVAPPPDALHRQRRDDRLGRDRAAEARPHRPLDFAPRPRWPLDPTAPPAIGAGVKA